LLLYSLLCFYEFFIFTLFKISFRTVEKSGVFSVVAYSIQTSLALKPTGLNHPNFGFFDLVPKSPTYTGLICVKPRSRISQAEANAPTYTVLAPTHLAPMFLCGANVKENSEI
jgi:hypothetical protein